MFGILVLAFCSACSMRLRLIAIAAVSSIAARRTSISKIVRLGLTWGLESHYHALSFRWGPQSCLATQSTPVYLARPLETAVGIMLLALGSNVLWRMWHDRVHFRSIPTSTGPYICIFMAMQVRLRAPRCAFS